MHMLLADNELQRAHELLKKFAENVGVSVSVSVAVSAVVTVVVIWNDVG